MSKISGSVVDLWTKGVSVQVPLLKRTRPILPVKGERNVLITSALPYVNNEPHLGNIIGCVLSGDVFARYCRSKNYNVLYVCGTDEYGTATETKAIQEGLTPQEICDKYYKMHSKIYEWCNIDFDVFGRTSTKEQTKIAQDIFTRLHERGFIVESSVFQLFCSNCDRFLADRFVKGTCPFCNYEGARGDQCEKCGHLINATELKSPRCEICAKNPEVKKSDHLFLDLDKLQPAVKEWSEKSAATGEWSNNAKIVTATWIRDGLKPRCITRDLKWGTPVPMQGYTEKVFYVWFDAPIGYLSITACYTEEWEKWWKNPKEVRLYQFMAKDNIPFHTVVFPSSLIGADDNYTLLDSISSTEYLNYESGKFSKSRGTGVFGTDAIETGIPADIFRFYLLFVRPETQDSTFSWNDFALKVNAELVNNLGNFINRILLFIKNNFASVVPAIEVNENCATFIEEISLQLKKYIEFMKKIKLRQALKQILLISSMGNTFFQSEEPWKLIKGNESEKNQAASCVVVCINLVCLLCELLQPYMPELSKEIKCQLRISTATNILLKEEFMPFLDQGHVIGEVHPIFKKFEEMDVECYKKQFQGK